VGSLTPSLKRLFEAKNDRRRKLAALPFPEKVKIVVQLQCMAAPVLRARGENVSAWTFSSQPPGTKADEGVSDV